LLTRCSDDDTYNAVECESGTYLKSRRVEVDDSNITEHGPAEQFSREGQVSVDAVPCVRCLVWPTQADDWPTRLRDYEWPDSATVNRVVNNGCDLLAWHIVSVDITNR